MASGLVLDRLSKSFAGAPAVAGVSLEVPPGQVLALLGPSGSGKTTTLRLIAGFESPDSGAILTAGLDVTSMAPAKRGFGMVFQSYALFPHLDVGQNVAFGLAGWDRVHRAREVAAALLSVDLAGFEGRRVDELSGGQQQRVAVARALAPAPSVLLLDEPLSNLDPDLRERTREQLREILERTGVTAILVTHEQEEAFALGDLVAVLNKGRLEQLGTPEDLYDAPRSIFVAGFVGRSSQLEGTVSAPGVVRVGDHSWPLRSNVPVGSAVDVAVRPESVAFAAEGLAGRVVARRFLGARSVFGVETEIGALEVEASSSSAAVGDAVSLKVETCHAYPRQSPPRP